jgi:glutamate 5-kinase
MQSTRQKYLSSIRTVVIKLGTQLLTDKQGSLDTGFIQTIAKQVVALRARGLDVTIVSSGAIGAGLRELKLPKRPTDLAKLQAVAAVGQRRLMDAWAAAFAPDGIHVAQILLTREDIDHRGRFLNLRNTVGAIHDFGAIPIINENDTVSTDELIKITFGDNDILAATVTHALQAHLLVLMTVVDGILDTEKKSVRLVDDVAKAFGLVRTEKSALGKGGMSSKVQAAKLVTDAGQVLMVADGRMPNLLTRLLDGEELGTLFVPADKKWSSRSRWIGSVRPAGSILVDSGCVKALVEHRKSLLAAGVTGTEGAFDQGDVVAVIGPDGVTVAKGLSNYAATDVSRIAGKKTTEVRQLLAEAAYDEVIHCNNMVLEMVGKVRNA